MTSASGKLQVGRIIVGCSLLAMAVVVLMSVVGGRALNNAKSNVNLLGPGTVVPAFELKKLTDSYAVGAVDAVNKAGRGEYTAESLAAELTSIQNADIDKWIEVEEALLGAHPDLANSITEIEDLRAATGVVLANLIADVEAEGLTMLPAYESELSAAADALGDAVFTVFDAMEDSTIEIVSETSDSTGAAAKTLLIAMLFSVVLLGAGTFFLVRMIANRTRGEEETNSEANRLRSMVEDAPMNLMIVDSDLVVQYFNPASRRVLESLDQHLPPVDSIIGSRLDAFHQTEHTGGSLSDPANLPHRAIINVGPEKVDLLTTAIYGDDGSHTGALTTWEVVTDRLLILDVIEAAAGGDFTKDIHVEGDDIFAKMAAGLRELLRSLSGSIGGIAKTATGVAAAAEQLTRVSSHMGSTAEETATQASVVSQASEHVTNNVGAVAAASEQIGESIREIAMSSSNASSVAIQAVKVAATTSETVTRLGDSSNEIGQIVKVITSIAQQTNLLALNATIEAARAGEVGKGFAVVANEVKELAKETAQATEDIAQKIEVIQSDTGSVVDAIGDISEIIDEISGIQATIASAVEQQAATTSEIGQNVTEAARGSSDITENIGEVANAASTTSAGAGETLESAKQLATMATELQSLVGEFTYG